jgi:hypothetical protein
MTNETTINSMLLEAAKLDCQKRTEHARRIDDLKQMLCWFLLVMAFVMVGLRLGYPELTSGSVKTNTTVTTETKREANIVEVDEPQDEGMMSQATEIQPETENDLLYSEPTSEQVVNETAEANEPETGTRILSLSDYDLCLLTQAIQHETLIFQGYSNYDMIQQYMAASILNRLGERGFGTNYTTAYTIIDLLSNYSQYENILWELDYFDAYDSTTRRNIEAVLNGTAYTPQNLFYERCSDIGVDYWTAQNNFYAEYPEAYSMQIVFMELSPEGRYIIFAVNPYGAYAY